MSQQPTPWWKIFLFAALGISILFGSLMVLLPRRYYVSRSLVIEAPPEQVYASVADLRTWPDWAVWFTRTGPAKEVEFPRGTRGKGAEVLFTTATADVGGRFLVVEDSPDTQLTLEAFTERDSKERSGLHRFQFSSEDGGTRVVWSMIGEVGEGWFAALTVGPRERVAVDDFDKSLLALKSCVEADGCVGGVADASPGASNF